MPPFLKVSLFLLLCVDCARSATAAPPLSIHSYRIKGEMAWTFGTNVLRLPTEVFRDGDTLKLAQIIQPAETNYYAAAFLNTTNCVVSFSQFEKEIAGEPISGRGWNNGQVWVSKFRMPVTAQLVPIWLMVAAREEQSTVSNAFRLSLFMEGHGSSLHERSWVTPEFSVDERWPDGFGKYSEYFTNRAANLVRQSTFEITAWTNCNGVEFPRSCAGTIRDATDRNVFVRYEFVATEITPLLGRVETRIPIRSSVIDWRPLETGQLKTGCSYSVTNGVLFADIVEAARLNQIDYGEARDWAQSQAMPAGTLAPDFAVRDLNGRSLKLSTMRGKYVLLNFWSTTCGPCLGEIPTLKEAYDAYGNDPRVVMIGFALDDNKKKVASFVKEHGIEWPQALLTKEFDDRIAQNYKVSSIPTVLIIGSDGKIVYQPGGGFKEVLEDLLKAEKARN